MTKEYHKDTGATFASYGAGNAFDACGHATPFWTCTIAYMYSEIDKAYWVYAVQTYGTGMVANHSSRETEMASLAEVWDCLEYFEALEMHCRQVYGE